MAPLAQGEHAVLGLGPFDPRVPAGRGRLAPRGRKRAGCATAVCGFRRDVLGSDCSISSRNSRAAGIVSRADRKIGRAGLMVPERKLGKVAPRDVREHATKSSTVAASPSWRRK